MYKLRFWITIVKRTKKCLERFKANLKKGLFSNEDGKVLTAWAMEIEQKTVEETTGISQSNLSLYENDKKNLGYVQATKIGLAVELHPMTILFPNGIKGDKRFLEILKKSLLKRWPANKFDDHSKNKLKSIVFGDIFKHLFITVFEFKIFIFPLFNVASFATTSSAKLDPIEKTP